MVQGSDNERELSVKADAAFRQAAAKVILRARQTGTPVIIWKQGRVEAIPADQFEQRVKRGSPEATASGSRSDKRHG